MTNLLKNINLKVDTNLNQKQPDPELNNPNLILKLLVTILCY